MRDNWEAKRISEICNVKGGKRLPAGEEFDLGKTPFPYLRVTNMVNGSIDDSDLKYVKIEIEPLIRNYKISKNDLYVTIAGTLGNFGSIPDHLDDAQLTENAAKLCDINFKIISKKYLKYYLNSRLIEDQIFREIGVGGGVPKLAIHRIQSLKVNLPKKLSQQKKIAQILSTCDTVLEKTESAIVKYQALKQGLMHDLFRRGIDVATGQLRPSSIDAPDLYKETELGFVPKEWEVRDLLSVTSLITDGAHFSPVPQEKGLPIGNVKDIKNGRIDYDNCTNILPEVFEDLKRQNCSPKLDDVLLSKDGTIGRVVHFTDSRPIVLLSSIAIIRPNVLVFPGYLANILKSGFFDKALYKLLSGSALKRITLRDIQKINMLYPKDVEEQKVIAIRLNSIDQKIQTEQQTLAKYSKLKAGLMQDLLSGKVGVEGLISK